MCAADISIRSFNIIIIIVLIIFLSNELLNLDLIIGLSRVYSTVCFGLVSVGTHNRYPLLSPGRSPTSPPFPPACQQLRRNPYHWYHITETKQKNYNNSTIVSQPSLYRVVFADFIISARRGLVSMNRTALCSFFFYFFFSFLIVLVLFSSLIPCCY